MRPKSVLPWAWVALCVLLTTSVASAVKPAPSLADRGMEADFDRPGADYRQVPARDPYACQRACKSDDRCQAFTQYEGTCYLKDEVPAGQPKAGCVSGIIQRTRAQTTPTVTTPGETSIPVPRLTRAGPSKRKPAAPPTQWIDLGKPGSRALRAADRDDVLGTGDEGAISVWLKADWDDAYCAEQQALLGAGELVRMYVYDHGTTQRARFRVAVTCDRMRVLLEHDNPATGYVWDEVFLVGDGLSDGKEHQLNLRTNSEGTEIWLDEDFVGALGVGYQPYRSAPLAVGSMNSGQFLFPGKLARLRVYDHAIDAQRLVLLGGMSDADMENEPEWSNVVAHFSAPDAPKHELKLKSPDWDPAGLARGRPWMLSGQEGHTQVRTDERSVADLTFQAFPMHSLFWADACELPTDAPSPGNKDCGTQVMVMATVSHNKADQAIAYRLFERQSPERFREIGGSATLSPGSRPHDMKVGSEIWALPEAEPQNDEYGGAWVGGGTVNMDFASKGYHLKRLDPFDVTKTGADGFIFGMNVAYMNQYRKKAWRKEANSTLPWGLWIDHTTIGCNGERQLTSVTNEQQYADTVGENWGFTIMNFSVNETFKETTDKMYRNQETVISSNARCTNYVLVMDRARATLSNGFRSAVTTAAEACTTGGQCEHALRVLVDRYGTHYPNALGYGGVAEMRAVLTENETRVIKSLETTQGQSFEQDVSISGTIGTGQASPVQASVTVGTSFKNGANQLAMSGTSGSEVLKEIEEKMRFVSRGGRGGATFESWSADESTAIPIYADIRPLPELLAPPFFTDRRVIDVVRPALEAYMQQLLQLDRLKTEQFNTQQPFHVVGLEYDTDRPGGDYKNVKTKTAVACRDLCKRDSGCHAFTFVPQRGNVCFMKKGAPGKRAGKGMVSAIVRTPPKRPEPPKPTKDRCGVVGGNNACEKPCPARKEIHGNDYVFIDLNIPETRVGGEVSFSNVCVAEYDFPRCYRVCLNNRKYRCERTPRGGVWKFYGSTGRDAACHDSGNKNQPNMGIRTK